MPTPASPTIVTSSQRCSASTRSQSLAAERELALPSDEPHPCAPLRRLAHAHDAVGGDRLGSARQLQRLDRLDLGGVADERERRLADQHLARRRGLLEPLADRDRVPGDEAAARCRAAGDDLAGGDADPRLRAEARRARRELECRAQRAQRVVLVHDRDAEHGHQPAVERALDGAAVTLDDRRRALEAARHHELERLGIELPSGAS